MHRYFFLCFLLLTIQQATAQKNIILSGTIQENGQLTPVMLTLSISKDTITGICKTVFPVGTKNSEETGTWPVGNSLHYYQEGTISLTLGNARYKRLTVPFTGYLVADGFTLDIVKEQGKWTGRFADIRAEQVIRKGIVSFTESQEAVQTPVIKKKVAPVIKAAPVKKDSIRTDIITKAAPPVVIKPADTFSQYQPLYHWSRGQVTLSIVDAFREDGDVISWDLDGGGQKEVAMTNTPQQFILSLSPGKVHVLTVTLLNEGTERGNTPAIDLSDGTAKIHRDLNGDFGKIYHLYLLYQP